MAEKSRLAERLEQLKNKGGSGSKSLYKYQKDGSKDVVRQIPYMFDADLYPFIEAFWHYNITGRPVLCPNKTFGDPCPICDLDHELYNIGSEEAFALHNSIKAKLRVYSPIIVRGDEEAGVKLWSYGIQIYTSLLEKYEDKKWGNLSDPASGRDIEIWSTPKGHKSNDTDYNQPSYDVFPGQSALFDDKKKMETLIKSVPNFLEDREIFPVLSFEELSELVRKLDDGADGADKNVVMETKNTTKNSMASANDRLSSLLGD